MPVTRFDTFVRSVTQEIFDHAEAITAEPDRPFIFLTKTVTQDHGQTKEDMAKAIADRDGITEGLVCVLRAVEPTTSFSLRNGPDGTKVVVRRMRKCLKFYFYLIDPAFGSCTSGSRPGCPGRRSTDASSTNSCTCPTATW